MNGYDAIMQGRHSLRNTTQPSDTEYGLLSVYSFRGNDKRGERREERRGKERKTMARVISPTRIQIRRSVARIFADIALPAK